MAHKRKVTVEFKTNKSTVIINEALNKLMIKLQADDADWLIKSNK